MRISRNAIALLALFALAACAHQVPTTVQPGAPGFLLGLWHGFIFPVAWFLSLVMKDVAVYAVPNSGFLYNLGYFIGIVFFGVGAHRGGRRVIVRDRVVTTRGPIIENE